MSRSSSIGTVEWDRKRCETVCGAGVGFGTVGIAAPQRGALRVLAQQLCNLLGFSDRHSTASGRPQAASRGPAEATLVRNRIRKFERFLELLCRPKIVHVMQVRAIRGLFRQQVIYPPYHCLELLHSSKRHRPSLAEGSDGMCPEVVESIRHVRLQRLS